MEQYLTIIYWKSEHFWLGKLVDHPVIMTQGETLDELEENLKDAYLSMVMERHTGSSWPLEEEYI